MHRKSFKLGFYAGRFLIIITYEYVVVVVYYKKYYFRSVINLKIHIYYYEKFKIIFR